MEESPYFTAISNVRSMLLTEEEQLAGCTTISLETCADLAEEDILSFITDNFYQFLKTLRFLKTEDQELLLSYYLLSKTQNTLAIIHKSTQTVCSFRIRMAIKTLGTFFMMGEPTEEKLHRILEHAGMERLLEKEGQENTPNLSEVVMRYIALRNFQQVAGEYGLHRPDIRRAMSKASKSLMGSKVGEEMAIAAFLHSLIDKVSPLGTGLSKRKAAKSGHLYIIAPEITGQFKANIEDENWTSLFTSRATR